MASLTLTPEQEEEELRQQMSALAPQSMQSGFAGGGERAGVGRTARPGSGSPVARGGSPYVGLDKYVAANRGATEALGQRTADYVSEQGGKARSALGGATSAFNASVDQGTVQNDLGLLGRVSSDPLGLSRDTAAAGQLTRQRDAVYGGPSALEEVEQYGAVQPALTNARQTAELTKTESGIGELSDKTVTGPRTVGGRDFDTQLLLGTEGLRGRLDQARAGVDAIGGEVESASAAARTRAEQGAATTDATRTAARGSLTDAQSALQKALDERTAQQRQAAAARADQTQQQLALAQGSATSLPTAGAAGRYYADNDPTRGSFTDRGAVGGAADPALERALAAYWATPQGRAALEQALQTPQGQAQFAAGLQARDVPEFIHNTGGQALLPGFNAYLPTRQGAAPGADALSDLGITPEQWAAFANLAPVGEMANAATIGTNNVNPYSLLEAYESQLGDLGRFTTRGDPNALITQANVASADDYGRAAALAQLAGPELAQSVLDPALSGQAGTASLDLIDFDLGGAARARQAALEALAQRAGVHVAGNARSGSDSFIKQYGQAFTEPSTYWLGPLAPLVAAAKAS